MARKLDPIEPDVLQDMLLLADLDVPMADITRWTLQEREQAEKWAGYVHLSASDNPVRRVAKPAFLDRYPAANGQAL